MKTNSLLKGIGIGIVLFSLLSFTFIFSFGIKGSGKLIKETRVVENFNAIKAGGAFNINVIKGSPQSLIIETDDNLMELITSKVKNGELKLSTDGNINNSTKMNVYITIPSLKALDLSGACELTSESRFESDNMEIEQSGAASSFIKIHCNKLDIDISGAANINISGYSQKLEAEVSGASNINAYDLEVENAVIDCSGAASTKITVNKSLNGEASGASSIKYKGNPKNVDIRTSGAADIKRK